METAASSITQSASQPGRDLPAAARAAQSLYGPVAPWLERVEQRLKVELRSRFEELNPLLAHGVMLGGKRLRPALVLLAGASTGPLGSDHVTLGTVLEMVHTATLVHDDVLDKAEERRHAATVNALWDNSASILLGDFLFAHSFYLAASLGSTDACRAIGAASRRVCEGELRQVLRSGDLAISENTYLELIEGKTAELTRVACELGARASGASDARIAGLGHYGHALGIAFQMADDYLDLWGDDSRVGKTLGSDLAQGKATLPMIRALAQMSDAQRCEFKDCAGLALHERVRRQRALIEGTDARQYTRDRARHYVDEALEQLKVLPPSESRACLQRIAEFAMQRTF